jgi:hypothetical protein
MKLMITTVLAAVFEQVAVMTAEESGERVCRR